jgi:hypothetical protein
VKLAKEGGKDLKMKNYRLRMHLSPFFGHTPLTKIITFDIERCKKYRLEEDVKGNVRKDGTRMYKGKTSPGT